MSILDSSPVLQHIEDRCCSHVYALDASLVYFIAHTPILFSAMPEARNVTVVRLFRPDGCTIIIIPPLFEGYLRCVYKSQFSFLQINSTFHCYRKFEQPEGSVGRNRHAASVGKGRQERASGLQRRRAPSLFSATPPSSPLSLHIAQYLTTQFVTTWPAHLAKAAHS